MAQNEGEDDDEWLKNSAIPMKHAHALGVFTAYYNFLETVPEHLLASYLDIPAEARHLLYFRMTNRERVDLILELASSMEKREDVLDHIRYGLRCFDICVENRNILVHAQHEHSELALEGFQASKRAAADPRRLVHFDLPLSRLRSAADDIGNLVMYLMLLSWHIDLTRRNVILSPPLAAVRPTLPIKPAQPSRLTPRQLRPVP